MAVTPVYIPLYNLQQYFVDKDTGLPLSNGFILFFQDNSRSMDKVVYERTGSPPNYSYTALGSTVHLSAVGTPIDNSGNDIVIYVLPFDVDGNVELYYLEVYDEGGVLQFTREGVPSLSTAETPPVSAGSSINNLIINGTFFFGQPQGSPIATSPVTIALGNSNRLILPDIYFLKNTFTATDAITFPAFGPGNTPLVGDVTPPNYFNYTCTNVPTGETFKSVNFPISSNSSSLDGQTLTLSFWAMSPLANTISVDLVQDFGAGGSPSAPVVTAIGGPITLTPSWTKYDLAVTVPSTVGQTLGTCGNDQLYMQINLQLNVSANISISNVLLVDGTFTVSPAYPYLTEQQVFGALGGPRTGDMKFSMRAPAELVDWLEMTDITIGSTASAATAKGTQYFPLYYYIYRNTIDTDAPVSGGRSGNPFNDFAANKTIFITAQQNRSMTGMSSTLRNGQVVGSATNTISVTIPGSALPAHAHLYDRYTQVGVIAASGSNLGVVSSSSTSPSTFTSNAGSGLPFNIGPFSLLSPTTGRNAYIKL